ncbi:hypothetical protein J0S82_007048, partial [Galemys pyrenaicus]
QKTEKLATKEKEPEAKKADAGENVKNGNPKPKTPKKGKHTAELSDILDLLCIPERQGRIGSIQQLSPGLKRKRRQLLMFYDSHKTCQCTLKVVESWLNHSKNPQSTCVKTVRCHHSWDHSDLPHWMSWKPKGDFPEEAVVCYLELIISVLQSSSSAYNTPEIYHHHFCHN